MSVFKVGQRVRVTYWPGSRSSGSREFEGHVTEIREGERPIRVEPRGTSTGWWHEHQLEILPPAPKEIYSDDDGFVILMDDNGAKDPWICITPSIRSIRRSDLIKMLLGDEMIEVIARVRAFLDARATMGTNVAHDEILTIWAKGEQHVLLTDDVLALVRALEGYGG